MSGKFNTVDTFTNLHIIDWNLKLHSKNILQDMVHRGIGTPPLTPHSTLPQWLDNYFPLHH